MASINQWISNGKWDRPHCADTKSGDDRVVKLEGTALNPSSSPRKKKPTNKQKNGDRD